MFGLLNIVDQWSGFILAFIPFYFFLKLCFLIFLMHPSTQGATMIYNTYILPGMKDVEKHIVKAESLVGEQFEKGKEAAEELKKKVM